MTPDELITAIPGNLNMALDQNARAALKPAKARNEEVPVSRESLADINAAVAAAYPNMPVTPKNVLRLALAIVTESNHEIYPLGIPVTNEAERHLVRVMLGVYGYQFEQKPSRPLIGDTQDAVGHTRIRFMVEQSGGAYHFLYALGAAMGQDHAQVDRTLKARVKNGEKSFDAKPYFSFGTAVYNAQSMLHEYRNEQGGATFTLDQFGQYFTPNLATLKHFNTQWMAELAQHLEADEEGKINVSPSGVAAIERYCNQYSKLRPMLESPNAYNINNVNYDAEALTAYPQLSDMMATLMHGARQSGSEAERIYCIDAKPEDMLKAMCRVNPALIKYATVHDNVLHIPAGPMKLFAKRSVSIAQKIINGAFEEADKELAVYNVPTESPKSFVAREDKRRLPEKDQAAETGARKAADEYEDAINEFMLPLAGLEPILDLRDMLRKKPNGVDVIYKPTIGEHRIVFESLAAARLAELQLMRLIGEPDNTRRLAVEQDPVKKRQHWLVLKQGAYEKVMDKSNYLRDQLHDLETDFKADPEAAKETRELLMDEVDKMELTWKHSSALKTEINKTEREGR